MVHSGLLEKEYWALDDLSSRWRRQLLADCRANRIIKRGFRNAAGASAWATQHQKRKLRISRRPLGRKSSERYRSECRSLQQDKPCFSRWSALGSILARRCVRFELTAATEVLRLLLIRDDKTQNATSGRNLNDGIIADNMSRPAHYSHHPPIVHKFTGRYFGSRPTAFASFSLRRGYRHHLSFGCGRATSTRDEKYEQQANKYFWHSIRGLHSVVVWFWKGR